MNVLSAIGNIGQSAELKYLPDATPVAQFSFALQAGYGDKQVTTWLRCSIFGKRAETLTPMLVKGSRIGITGELTNRPYKDKQGVEKYSLELRVSDVTLLGNKDTKPSEDRPERNVQNPTYEKDSGMDFESDVPF